MSNKRYLKIITPISILLFLFIAAELIFRILVFSDLTFMKKFRDPRLYADYFSDNDCWLLYFLFDKKHTLAKNPHPLLGWTGDFNPETLVHNEYNQINSRKPILLYGDSFAQCRDRPCFQDVINSDPNFNKKCFVLNYGVGGYGLDQIYLLMSNSLKLYKDPIVIFGMLTEDLDRNLLSFRTGEKPRFYLEDNELKLAKVQMDLSMYPTRNSRPNIYSYLFRLFVHGDILPKNIYNYLNNEDAKKIEKSLLSQAIIKKAIEDMNGLNFLFLVFVGNWPGVSSVIEEQDWRLDTILESLNKDNVTYLNAKTIIREDMQKTKYVVEDYFLPNDGHYKGYTNELIANKIKSQLIKQCN